MVDRREFLATAGSLLSVSALAGCTAGDDDGTETATDVPTATPTATPAVTEVAVGPERRLRLEPEEVEVGLGATVRWTAESVGHNVTSKPGASSRCRNPEGAEPFASYEGDDHFAVLEEGETFEHTFTVAGEYVYVCAPHEGQGMVGTVTVTE